MGHGTAGYPSMHARAWLLVWIALSTAWVGCICWATNPLRVIRETYSPLNFYVGDIRLQFPANTPVAVLRDKLSEVARSEAARDPPPEWALLDGVDRTVSRALGGYEPLSVWPVIASMFALMIAPPLGLL